MRVTCEICGKTFRNAAGLAGHCQFVHGAVGKRFLLKNEMVEALERLEKQVELLTQRLPSSNPGWPDAAEIERALRNVESKVGRMDQATQAVVEYAYEQLRELDAHTRRQLREARLGIEQRLDAMTPDEEEKGTSWGSVLVAALVVWALYELLGKPTADSNYGQRPPQFEGASRSEEASSRMITDNGRRGPRNSEPGPLTVGELE